MPLISERKEEKKETVSIEIQSDVLNDINNYCKWAKVNMNVFFEEAAKFIFKKDKEYKSYLKNKK